mmetsp:Transcript_23434/g.69022  ORF Transcript_23434/g.69022 Transcript_23434/m.69022 type:complete len:276 (+) Transcript_23434:213-1040(+)
MHLRRPCAQHAVLVLAHAHDLLRSRIGRKPPEAVFGGDAGGHEAASYIVRSGKAPRAELGCSERYEHVRSKASAGHVSLVHVPARRHVHGGHGHGAVAQLREDPVKRRAHVPGKAESEDGVNDHVELGLELGSRGHVRGHRDAKALELRVQVDKELALGIGLGHDHRYVPAKMPEVASGHEAVATIVARTADDEHALVGVDRIMLLNGRRHAQARKLHQLVDAEARFRHELHVQLGRVRGIQERHRQGGDGGGHGARRRGRSECRSGEKCRARER